MLQGNSFEVGDLIFGKLKGFDWWPGQVITHRLARQRPALSSCQWINWFGDNKVSEVSIIDFDEE